MLSDTIENLLNRGLPRSPRAQQLCLELAGRRIAIDASPLLRFVVESNGVALKVSTGAGDADAHVRGGPFSLLALGGPDPRAVLQRGDVQIRGDAELAEKFRELARLLRPDLEDELSHVIGDIPAHHVGRFTRAAVGWTQNAANTTLRNAAEFLAHESRDLVPRREAAQLLNGIDALREDVDRLAARIDLVAPRPQLGASSLRDA